MPKPAIGGNKSLKNIVGETPSASAWEAPKGNTGAAGDSTGDNGTNNGEESAVAETPGNKGKKGKGKQKQTLFTLGVFPS